MTTDEAARILRTMYFEARKGECSLQPKLFGIKYANELEGLSINEIVEKAALTKRNSYGTEIRKGMNLANHVMVLDESDWYKLRGRCLALESIVGLLVQRATVTSEELNALCDNAETVMINTPRNPDPKDDRMTKERYFVYQGWNEAFLHVMGLVEET